MKNLNKFKKMLLLLVLGVVLAGQVSIAAQAASPNLANTPFYFSGEAWGTSATGSREKNTTSVCFIHITKITPASVSLYIDGWRQNRGTWVNRTRGDVAVATRTGYFQIHNYVRENGDTHARLTAWFNNGRGVIAGEWSPDSAESNTPLN